MTAESDRENARRADQARKTVDFRNQITEAGDDGLQTNMVDLVADLMHLAAAEGIDFDDQVLRIARNHFEAEQAGEA